MHLAAEDGRARSYGHDLKRELRQLIGFNTDRAAVQRGVSLSWGAQIKSRQREMAQARSSATAGACGNETHLRTSADGSDD
jgi:hypothetical protein